MKKDINWINAVKAICMLMVYVVHCESYYGHWLGHVNVLLHPVYVNAFFFVSGYLLFRKQLSQPVIGEPLARYTSTGGSGRKILYNIVFRLFIPALLFSIVCFLPNMLLKGGSALAGSFFFKTLGGGTYWFVGALLVCQLFILLLLLTRQRRVWFYAAMLGLAAMAGTVALPFYGSIPNYYAFQLAPLCMGFIALGALYWRYEPSHTSLLTLLILAVVYLAFFILLRNDAQTLISMGMLNLTGFVGSAIGCLLMVAVCKQLPRIAFLTFIGQNSIVFYLLSGAVPVVVNILFKRLIPVPGIVDLLVYIAVCVALATAITWVIVRYMPFLTDLRLFKKTRNQGNKDTLKIALILPGSLWYAPYVRIYTRLLEAHDVSHAIISWNREGDDHAEGFQYQVPCPQGHGSASLSAYKGYISFIRQTLRQEGFDRLIVFGPQMTCLLAPLLLLRYRRRYIIDYRDLSIEQRTGFRQLFTLMLRFSCANVVSSPGFLPYLPKAEYLLSHNLQTVPVDSHSPSEISAPFHQQGWSSIILTIGAIRDPESNLEVVRALANRDGFTMQFVGKGHAAPMIEHYCQEQGIKNVSFTGFYEKEEEARYVEQCTVMNIFYPRVVTHDTALSNRFYLSLQHHKPMIVTRGTTQGDYAERYQVGIAVDDCHDLANRLHEFLSQDRAAYEKRCEYLLACFIEDQRRFEAAVTKFITS